jgi:hypothetical protein
MPRRAPPRGGLASKHNERIQEYDGPGSSGRRLGLRGEATARRRSRGIALNLANPKFIAGEELGPHASPMLPCGEEPIASRNRELDRTGGGHMARILALAILRQSTCQASPLRSIYVLGRPAKITIR